MIYRPDEGPLPTFTDPLNGETYQCAYEKEDTWTTRFGKIATSYEECRADTCAFYLCTFKEVYTLFGYQDHEVDTLFWVTIMNQLRKAILGLTMYNPDAKKWGQAHTQGAFVLTQWFLKN